MADFLPTDDARADRHDRTARIEELLLSGLDYYFAGEHERAINIWTRVLFLDRGHARARAYIDRARGALAERQRESEELIQQGMAAFDQGDTARARELLSTAIARGGPHDVALALLDRLNRLEAASQANDAVPRDAGGAPPARRRPHARRPSTSRSWAVFVPFIIAVGLVALYVAISFSDLGMLRPARLPGQATAVDRPAQESVPLPRSADLVLWRATALKNTGRLKDALTALDRIGPGDAAYAEAARLRAEIQALLLAGLPPMGGAGRGTGK
jgi:tetratricopeptide (TPR) repeat protein